MYIHLFPTLEFLLFRGNCILSQFFVVFYTERDVSVESCLSAFLSSPIVVTVLMSCVVVDYLSLCQ